MSPLAHILFGYVFEWIDNDTGVGKIDVCIMRGGWSRRIKRRHIRPQLINQAVELGILGAGVDGGAVRGASRWASAAAAVKGGPVTGLGLLARLPSPVCSYKNRRGHSLRKREYVVSNPFCSSFIRMVNHRWWSLWRLIRTCVAGSADTAHKKRRGPLRVAYSDTLTDCRSLGSMSDSNSSSSSLAASFADWINLDSSWWIACCLISVASSCHLKI